MRDEANADASGSAQPPLQSRLRNRKAIESSCRNLKVLDVQRIWRRTSTLQAPRRADRRTGPRREKAPKKIEIIELSALQTSSHA
jgi:hypothetical protein